MSFVSAPPRDEVHVVTAIYGTLTGAFSAARARLWILLDDGDPMRPFARICTNDPATGQPVYRDLGPVVEARSGNKRLEFTTTPDTTWLQLQELTEPPLSYALIEAPCVCGAGAAGMAGPVTGRYETVRVRADQLPWLQLLP